MHMRLPHQWATPETRENFSDELEWIVIGVNNRNTLIIAGNFNAKTGRAWKECPDNIDKYGKGEMNSNGMELLGFCKRRQLVLASAPFPHRMSHRPTWESPATQTRTHTEKKRNPYRNVVDISSCGRQTEEYARSRNGIRTYMYMDHRLVLERLHILKKKTVILEFLLRWTLGLVCFRCLEPELCVELWRV